MITMTIFSYNLSYSFRMGAYIVILIIEQIFKKEYWNLLLKLLFLLRNKWIHRLKKKINLAILQFSSTRFNKKVNIEFSVKFIFIKNLASIQYNLKYVTESQISALFFFKGYENMVWNYKIHILQWNKYNKYFGCIHAVVVYYVLNIFIWNIILKYKYLLFRIEPFCNFTCYFNFLH